MSRQEPKAKSAFYLREKVLRDLLNQAGAIRVSATALQILDTLLAAKVRQILKSVDLLNEVQVEAIMKANDECPEVIPEEFIEDIKKEKRLRASFVHYIWIIKANGTCIFSESYSGMAFPDTLFAGLIIGIANMVEEVSGRTLDYLVIGDLIIHLNRMHSVDPPITVAAIVDTENRSRMEAMLNKIGNAFLKKYGKEVRNEVVNISLFEDFSNTIEAIISSESDFTIPTDTVFEKSSLSDERIKESVFTAALRGELEKASAELKKMSVFGNEKADVKADTKGKLPGYVQIGIKNPEITVLEQDRVFTSPKSSEPSKEVKKKAKTRKKKKIKRKN